MGLTNFIQRALKFDKNSTALIERKPASQLPTYVHVCFTIKVYGPVNRKNGNGRPTEVKELEAGKSYEVVILSEESRNQADQADITVTENFTLEVQGVFSSSINHSLLHQTFDVAYSDICKPKHELPVWSIEVPADLPTCKLKLSLTFEEPPFHPWPDIVSHTLSVRGNTTLHDLQVLEASNVDAELPENAAILSLASENVAESSEGFVVKTSNRYINNLSIALRTKFIVGVAQQYPKETIASILAKISTFSLDHAGELMTWLRQFRAACQQRQQCPCLIIVDTTVVLEIPWELLEIDSYYTYLGAIAQVVRWYPFKPYGKPLLLKVKDVVYTGSLLSYLDQSMKVVSIIEREKATVSHFEKEDLPNLEALRKRLLRVNSMAQIGMVYVVCHGQEGNMMSTGARDTLQVENRNLRALEIVRMPEHAEPRPIFFMNTCDSARMLRGSKTNPANFAESFLIQCASGYIGTMTAVGSNRASLIAQDILKQAMAPEGVQIAEALRVLRHLVVEKLRDSDRDASMQKELDEELFFTFMYVYYGNPLARLRLLTATSEKEGA